MVAVMKRVVVWLVLLGACGGSEPRPASVAPSSERVRTPAEERTLEALNDHLKQHPTDADALVRRGDLHLQMKNFASARADYKLAREVQPGYAPGWMRFGWFLYEFEGRPDEAAANLTRAIELDPRYADAYYYRGRARQQRGQFKEALADYEAALQNAPAGWPHADKCSELAAQVRQLPSRRMKDSD